MSFYPYFVATLPSLALGRRAPFGAAEFIARASDWLPGQEIEALNAIADPAQPSAHPWVTDWRAFQLSLRNALAAARAERLGIDAGPWLREGGEHRGIGWRAIAGELVRIDQPEEAERALDQLCWQAAEERAANHVFDFAVIAAYLVHLTILERWQQFDTELGQQRLQAAVAGSVNNTHP